MGKCEYCDKEMYYLKLKFFATNYKDKRLPKYNFVVKAHCVNCGKWIKHLKQEPEVMENINSFFDSEDIKGIAWNDVESNDNI